MYLGIINITSEKNGWKKNSILLFLLIWNVNDLVMPNRPDGVCLPLNLFVASCSIYSQSYWTRCSHISGVAWCFVAFSVFHVNHSECLILLMRWCSGLDHDQQSGMLFETTRITSTHRKKKTTKESQQDAKWLMGNALRAWICEKTGCKLITTSVRACWRKHHSPLQLCLALHDLEKLTDKQLLFLLPRHRSVF